MKLLICDDELNYVRLLTHHVNEYMSSRGLSCDIAAVANPELIIRNKTRFDLAILDIEMPDVDGISLAEELKRRNGKIVLFFVTNFRGYQDAAMDLKALRYFDKPLDIERLYAGLDKAMEYIDGAYADVFLSGEGGSFRVAVDDILYITRGERRTMIVTKRGAFPVRNDYDALCEKLPVRFFCAVHKSFFVNLHYVDKYSYKELVLLDGTRVPIASRKQTEFHKFWFEYIKRR